VAQQSAAASQAAAAIPNTTETYGQDSYEPASHFDDFTDSAENIDSILGELAATPLTPLADLPPPPVVLELLKQAGIISFEDAEAALKLQTFHGGEPGRFLVELGCIDTRTFVSATQAEKMMARFSLNLEDAALTLKYCYKKGITVEEALAELE
jgi:hypothetical protein